MRHTPLIALILAAAAAGIAAHAAPPENADPRLSDWYGSLRQPGTGMSCCSIAECRPADQRVTANGYEVFVGGEWRVVPPEKIIQGKENLDGRPVVCWTPALGVMCFVRGTET